MFLFAPVAFTPAALVLDHCDATLGLNLLDGTLSAELALYRSLEVAKAHEIFHRGRKRFLQILTGHVELESLQRTAILIC